MERLKDFFTKLLLRLGLMHTPVEHYGDWCKACGAHVRTFMTYQGKQYRLGCNCEGKP